MERLGLIRTRIDSIAQLREVVIAMRSLAAVRMSQATELLDGARRYADIIAAALSQALLLTGGAPPPPRDNRPALLLFATEHGFVGGYGEALATAAAKAAGDGPLLVIGRRGARTLGELGHQPDWAMAMAPHAAGVPLVARQAAAELGRRFLAGEFTRLEVMFGRLEPGGGWSIAHDTLLPPDFSRFRPIAARVAPLHHLAPADLLAGLVEEYLLADLVRAATESLAAENAARLRAMTTAADNIERKLDDLRAEERVMRQEQITDELLDVLNGALALATPGG